MSKVIGAVISSGLATLHELDEVYSLEDAYDLLEVARIDIHNQNVMREAKK